MVPWWFLLIALVVGASVGFIIAALVTANDPDCKYIRK